MNYTAKIFVLGLLVLSGNSFAFNNSPACLDKNGTELSINNQNVITMESSTPNQYLTRAHVQGTVGNIYPDHNGHNHFEAILGPNPGDSVEVVYNQSFGSLPNLVPGMTVEACGDYITSTQATSQYPASPDRAILHWVHKSDSKTHESGFVILNGSLFGQGNGSGALQ